MTPAARAELQRKVELKKRELRLAAQRFGAAANDRAHRVDARPLGELVDEAARALARAELDLAILDSNVRRSA